MIFLISLQEATLPKAQNQLHQNAWMRWFFAVFIFVLWTHFNWWVKCTVNVIIENKNRWISQMKFHKAFRNLSIFIKGSISKPRSILYSFNFSINTTPTQKGRLDFNIKWFLILLYEVRKTTPIYWVTVRTKLHYPWE